jgi:Holliday junction resolvase RusA-like endonuclease
MARKINFGELIIGAKHLINLCAARNVKGIQAWLFARVFIHRYPDPDVEKEKTRIQWIVKSQLPPDFRPYSKASKKGLSMGYSFYFPVPQRFSKKQKELLERDVCYRPSKPDTDNLQKNINDALNGLLFEDDSIIVDIHRCSKKYGKEPRTEISFFEVDTG